MKLKDAHLILPAQLKLMNDDNESHVNVLQQIHHCTQGGCYGLFCNFFLRDLGRTCLFICGEQILLL